MKYGGFINEKDAQKLKTANAEEVLQSRRIKRYNDEVPVDDCCCPPRNVMMPTIISEKQFKETVKRMTDDN